MRTPTKRFAIIALILVALGVAAYQLLPPSEAGRTAVTRLTPVDRLSQAQASKIASRLTVGMREEDAEKLLSQNGLTNSLKLGCSHGWTSVFILPDGCNLALDISPQQARADGAWAGGLVRAADLQSNGVKIATITLKNAP